MIFFSKNATSIHSSIRLIVDMKPKQQKFVKCFKIGFDINFLFSFFLFHYKDWIKALIPSISDYYVRIINRNRKNIWEH